MLWNLVFRKLFIILLMMRVLSWRFRWGLLFVRNVGWMSLRTFFLLIWNLLYYIRAYMECIISGWYNNILIASTTQSDGIVHDDIKFAAPGIITLMTGYLWSTTHPINYILIVRTLCTLHTSFLLLSSGNILSRTDDQTDIIEYICRNPITYF